MHLRTPIHPVHGAVNALLVILFGALVLPMLPVWQGALRTLAGLVLIYHLRNRPRTSVLVCVILVASWSFALFSWGQSLLISPVSHLIASLTDVYGQPLGIMPDAMLLFGDSVCLVGLLSILRSRKLSLQRIALYFVYGLLLLWGSGLLAISNSVLSGADTHGTLAQMMTGLAGWSTWIFWAFLALLLLRGEKNVCNALLSIGLAGGLVGILILGQWLLGDFSYVLTSLDYSSSFNRVRGTDYYHAPATFATALGSLALFGYGQVRKQVIWLILACALGAIVALNNTRGISLAYLAGTFILLAGALYCRRKVAIICLLAVAALTLPNVFYLKPTYPDSSNLKADQQYSTPQTTQQLSTANQPRALLASEGVTLLREIPLIGTGVGTLNLPLEGKAFNGMASTYSTHVLYLDVALMGGILALFGFLFALLMSIGRIFVSLRMAVKNPAVELAAGFALLSAYVVAWLFLPQERNELIGVAWLIAALIFCVSHPISAESRPVSLPLRGYTFLALCAVGWVIVTSPRYVFPAIELLGRYGREIVKNNYPIYVTEPATLPIVQALVRLRGGSSRVFHLADNLEATTIEPGWVIWNPINIERYKNLVSRYGSPRYAYYNFLAFSPPSNWWVMPSAQPVASIIYAGPRGELVGATENALDGCWVYPNFAPYANVKVDGASGTASNVADYNYGSVVLWPVHSGEARIQFGLDTSTPGRLRAYRITALAYRSIKREEIYEWVLEGSEDEKMWHEIEHRSGQRLSQNGKEPSKYLLADAVPAYRYLRFRFLQTTNSHDTYAGVSEIELFFEQPQNRAFD